MDQQKAIELASQLDKAINESLKDIPTEERFMFIVCFLVGGLIKSGLEQNQVLDIFDMTIDMALKAIETAQKDPEPKPGG